MNIGDLLGPLGAAAYTALLIAALTGILKFKFGVRWISFKWHMWAGILAAIFATLHLLVFIYTNF